jgi:hypothetical protein
MRQKNINKTLTDPHRDDPVRQLSSEATIAIEKVAAEHVASGALAEG